MATNRIIPSFFEQKNFLKNFKKMLDKFKSVVYTMQQLRDKQKTARKEGKKIKSQVYQKKICKSLRRLSKMTNNNEINNGIENEINNDAASVENAEGGNNMAIENTIDTDAAIAAVATIYALSVEEVKMALTKAAAKGNPLKNAVVNEEGKYIITILYEGDGPMAYCLNAEKYAKVRVDSKLAYSLIEEDKAVKFEIDDFNAFIKSHKDAKKAAEKAQKAKKKAQKELEKAMAMAEKAQKALDELKAEKNNIDAK